MPLTQLPKSETAGLGLAPLLGNRTLRRMQVIMDCGRGKLIIPDPGGVEVKMSPGSRVFDLELTSSGHWVLPVHPRNQTKPVDEKELSFNISCRKDKSQSPPPKRRETAADSQHAKAGSSMDASAVASEPFHSIQATDKVPEPIVKPKITSRVDTLAWVFSDKVGPRQRLLQELNFRTVHFLS